MSRDGLAALPRGAMELFAVFDCGISWSYSLFWKSYQYLTNITSEIFESEEAVMEVIPIPYFDDQRNLWIGRGGHVSHTNTSLWRPVKSLNRKRRSCKSYKYLTMELFAVFDCGISWSYSLFWKSYQYLTNITSEIFESEEAVMEVIPIPYFDDQRNLWIGRGGHVSHTNTSLWRPVKSLNRKRRSCKSYKYLTLTTSEIFESEQVFLEVIPIPSFKFYGRKATHHWSCLVEKLSVL